jgi:hypothetical protein
MGGHMQVVMMERMLYRSQVGCLENFSRCRRGHRFEMHPIAQVFDP